MQLGCSYDSKRFFVFFNNTVAFDKKIDFSIHLVRDEAFCKLKKKKQDKNYSSK